MTVKSKHKEYTNMQSRWEACRAAAAGEEKVHDLGERFLPRLEQEGNQEYYKRVTMTPFFNATWRTIAGLRGMLFRKPPTHTLSPTMLTLAENIDLAGTELNGLAQKVTEEALMVGRVGLLVDYPVTSPNATLADARLAGARPMIKLYAAEVIYNWKEEVANGVRTLTQVRLEEEVELPGADEFEVKCEPRYRVLDLYEGRYRQRLFKVEGDKDVQVGEDVFPVMKNAPMTFIPFVFIGVDCVGPKVEDPPLIDLVTTNLHHYFQSSSYERGCWFSGLPTMFISGSSDDDGDVMIGGSVANLLGNPNAKAYYVEVASNFEALRTNLEDKKREMAVLGARMLEGARASRGNPEAAETVARRQSGEEAVLSGMATTLSQGLTRALQWVAEWAGVPDPKLTYEVNRDFMPMTMTAQDLTALVSSWQNGAISHETLFDKLKAGEVIGEDTTFEIEQERINSAQLNLAAQQAAADAQAALDFQAKAAALTQGA